MVPFQGLLYLHQGFLPLLLEVICCDKFIQQQSNDISVEKFCQYGETSLEAHLFDRVGGLPAAPDWFAIPEGRTTRCVIWSWEDSIQPAVG